MLLTALVSKSELMTLLESLTPFRVAIDRARGRSLILGRPEMAFVPGKGVRLRGDARLSWDVAGIAVPVTIQTWQVLLVPKVVAREGGRQLLFEPVVEQLDLKLVPGFLDDKIADVITDWISRNRTRLAWGFARTLSRKLVLPTKISPPETFEIAAVGGEVEVTETELRFTVRFEARIERAKKAPDKRDQGEHASAR